MSGTIDLYSVLSIFSISILHKLTKRPRLFFSCTSRIFLHNYFSLCLQILYGTHKHVYMYMILVFILSKIEKKLNIYIFIYMIVDKIILINFPLTPDQTNQSSYLEFRSCTHAIITYKQNLFNLICSQNP